MKEQFLEYEDALALKGLGFREPCFGEFWECAGAVDLFFGKECDELNEQNNYKSLDDIKYICSAPLYQQAFRWFREEHNTTSTIAKDGSLAKGGPWAYTIIYDNIYFNDGYFTYEESEKACIKQLIKLAKNEL